MAVSFNRAVQRDENEILDYYEAESGSLLADAFYRELLSEIERADPHQPSPLGSREGGPSGANSLQLPVETEAPFGRTAAGTSIRDGHLGPLRVIEVQELNGLTAATTQ